jgi:hypothetical protein
MMMMIIIMMSGGGDLQYNVGSIVRNLVRINIDM